MENRDYIEHQIEAFGMVLKGLVHWLTTGRLPSDISALNDAWQQRLDLPMYFFNDELLPELFKEPVWDENNLQTLVQCYLTLADRSDDNVAEKALLVARSIINQLEEQADTYSFERANLLERVENRLEQLQKR